MAKNSPSLQEIISRRQRAAFVGRQAQIAQFRENLLLPVDDPERRFIFSIHGDAGVGKTYLVQQLIEVAHSNHVTTAYTDENIYDIPSVMGAIASELASQNASLKNFDKHYESYKIRRSELENDPHAPEGIPSFLTTTAVQVGLSVGKSLPVAGPLLSAVNDDVVAEQADRLRKYISQKVRSSDIRLLLSPVDQLTPLFVEGLRTIGRREGIALFFDTYEHTAPVLDNWLTSLLAGRYGQLPAKLTITIAGQKVLAPNNWIPYLELIHDVQLTPFSDTEARQLLSNRGVGNADVVEVILALSAGLPLLVAMLAENRPDDPTHLGDPTGNAVERFLKWEADPIRRAIALAAALPRRINRDIFEVISDIPDNDGLFQWLRNLPFVWDQSGRCTYHAIVRGSMIRLFRHESPQGWRERHNKLASEYRRWRGGIEIRDEIGWSDTTWTGYMLEETYHSLCADSTPALPQALSNAVYACKAGSSTARRWAEMIQQAGFDADDSSLRAWGTRLLDSMKDEQAYVPRYLSILIEGANLDDTIQAIALADRGEAYRRMRRYDDALADFNLAIELNYKLTWVIAGRGETYRSMGRYLDAIADFNRAITQDPSLSWAVVDRGIAFRALGRYEEALKDFRIAIQMDPNYAWALANRGETYRLMFRYDEAISDFDRAVALDPDYAWAIASRGLTYQKMERYDEALADFDSALRLDRDLTRIYKARSRAYRVMGRLDDAIADLDRAIQLSPDNAWSIGLRGRIYLAKKWYEDALSDFDRAVEIDPELDWVFSGRGHANLGLRRYSDALADFDRALAIDPGFDDAIEGRRKAMEQAGEEMQT